MSDACTILGVREYDSIISPYNFLVPYHSSDDDDDDDDFSLHVNSRYVDSGWGGECLQDTEDIDFEFVYALHTFVATVEGQANATKGDTMVLLDDSNSYWWLVRVVKDSSIGKPPYSVDIDEAHAKQHQDTCPQNILRRRQRDWHV